MNRIFGHVATNSIISLNQTRDASDDFASNIELKAYYTEFLLTYRILFGQKSSSQRQFLRCFNNIEEYLQFPDYPKVLGSLCLENIYDLTFLKQRQVYSAEEDLPFLEINCSGFKYT